MKRSVKIGFQIRFRKCFQECCRSPHWNFQTASRRQWDIKALIYRTLYRICRFARVIYLTYISWIQSPLCCDIKGIYIYTYICNLRINDEFVRLVNFYHPVAFHSFVNKVLTPHFFYYYSHAISRYLVYFFAQLLVDYYLCFTIII